MTNWHYSSSESVISSTIGANLPLLITSIISPSSLLSIGNWLESITAEEWLAMTKFRPSLTTCAKAWRSSRILSEWRDSYKCKYLLEKYILFLRKNSFNLEITELLWIIDSRICRFVWVAKENRASCSEKSAASTAGLIGWIICSSYSWLDLTLWMIELNGCIHSGHFSFSWSHVKKMHKNRWSINSWILEMLTYTLDHVNKQL